MREPRQIARRADTLCLLWLRTVRRSRDLTCRILSQVRNYLTFLSTPFDFLPDFISLTRRVNVARNILDTEGLSTR